MPYIVTTRRPVDAVDCGHPEAPRDGWPVSRRAVATLDEAHNQAWIIVSGQYGGRAVLLPSSRRELYSALAIPESGGSVGPLPDGTVIDVEPTSVLRLYSEARYQGEWDETDVDKAVTAFNARHS